MSKARDFDDWRLARRTRGDRGANDPIPVDGLVERTYCALHARTGVWEPIFLAILRGAYGHEGVPARFVKRSAEIKAREARERKGEP